MPYSAASTETDVSSEGIWDEFLCKEPLGQFQQSSAWARFKKAEGWQLVRRIFQDSGGVKGGYQLLWKERKFMRIGYVSKGPVTGPDSPETFRNALDSLKQDARRLRLMAVILQLPDDASKAAQALAGDQGFVTCNPGQVVETTLRVDVHEGTEAIHGRMNNGTLRHLRQGQQRGIVLREGTDADLPSFFSLMQSSCRRQHVRPNPANLELLRQAWEAFAPLKSVRMTLALKEGSPIAGQISIGFGKCLFLWKKGWNGCDGNLRPNLLLEDDCLGWAHAAGYDYCDFGSLDAQAGRALRAGRKPSADTLRRRDVFNLQFGGHPTLLPQAMAYSPRRMIDGLLRAWGLGERLVR
jgi:hypothetical protein